jgi:5-methylcytosine-specific restriction endonuclease McrA
MANHACNSARSWCRNAARVWDNLLLLGWECAHCGGITSRPEVNHINPLAGDGANRLVWGCHHHQSGLEVLCRSCHQLVTNAQRRRGWASVAELPRQMSLLAGVPCSPFPTDRRGHHDTRHMRGAR